MAGERTIQEKIGDYLRTKMPGARDLTLSDWVQTAVGWSHEIYVFYANWREDGVARRQGFCLRKDPGSGLLRELSSLEEQFRVIKALENTAVPTPKAYWYEADPGLIGGPFFVMEKVEGEATESLVARGQAVLCGGGPARQVADELRRSAGLFAQPRLAGGRP